MKILCDDGSEFTIDRAEVFSPKPGEVFMVHVNLPEGTDKAFENRFVYDAGQIFHQLFPNNQGLVLSDDMKISIDPLGQLIDITHDTDLNGPPVQMQDIIVGGRIKWISLNGGGYLLASSVVGVTVAYLDNHLAKGWTLELFTLGRSGGADTLKSRGFPTMDEAMAYRNLLLKSI